jgi:hypothetical protein
MCKAMKIFSPAPESEEFMRVIFETLDHLTNARSGCDTSGNMHSGHIAEAFAAY